MLITAIIATEETINQHTHLFTKEPVMVEVDSTHGKITAPALTKPYSSVDQLVADVIRDNHFFESIYLLDGYNLTSDQIDKIKKHNPGMEIKKVAKAMNYFINQ